MPGPTAVVTLHAGLRVDLMDRILTDLERALTEAGATSIGIERSAEALTVCAELPPNTASSSELADCGPLAT